RVNLDLANEAGGETACPFRAPVAARKFGHGHIVVVDLTEGDVPKPVDLLANDIAGAGMADFHLVRYRQIIVIGRAADTSRIDDQPPVRKPRRAGDMTVGAKQERLRDASSDALDAGH